MKISAYVIPGILIHNHADTIQCAVEHRCGLGYGDSMKRTRKREIVEARQMVHYFVRKYGRLSMEEIGQKYGSMNHATVIHGIKTVEMLLETDKNYRERFEQIKNDLGYE